MAISMNGAYFNGLDGSGLQTALYNIKFPGVLTTDYILFNLNVASDTSADINYGWSGPVLARNQQITPATSQLLTSVVSAGVAQGQCKRVWLTIGSSVDPDHPQATSTFTNIDSILKRGGQLRQTLLMNFAAIVAAVGGRAIEAVGLDMDYEEDGDLASCVTDVTIALSRQLGPGCPITFCPYTQQADWITALQRVYSALGTQPVVGFNLQTYAGGGNNDPVQWAKLVASAKNTGVPDPARFIWPIVSCDPVAPPVSTPNQVYTNLMGWGSKGASLWATTQLSPGPSGVHLTDYSAAIAKAIR